MKATFQIPDALYREVKAEAAHEGLTVRAVAISLFEQWVRQRKQPLSFAAPVDWMHFQPPLSHLMPENVTGHGIDDTRNSITRNWNEPP